VAAGALAVLEAKFEESGGDVQKYLPERYAEVEKSLADVRDSMARKSYGDVVTGAAAAQDALKRAVADARVAHAQSVAALSPSKT